MKNANSGRALFLLLLLGCASAPGGGPNRTDPYTLIPDQLVEVDASNLYEAIRGLHPEWLSNGQVKVFRNGIEYGEVDSLRSLPVRTVTLVKFSIARNRNSPGRILVWTQ